MNNQRQDHVPAQINIFIGIFIGILPQSALNIHRMIDEMHSRACFLRAARAWLGEEQEATARASGVSSNTLDMAEKAQICSERTWQILEGYYGSRGLTVFELADGRLVLSVEMI
ncbi:hypothetical protein [Roseibium sp. RKSG952]|uniref:hypothetical protein n=1 Tax=Roseibium sp. RKSG952 TaxID=2529384 RepID=UPI0012BC8D16|nr:hypothetical protein [Roseibium sp. RKSG952]MTH96484.1 hypothetical protein [Roseibium sp. RKSG952]